MPLNASVFPIADVLGATTAGQNTVPVRTGERGLGGERTSAAKRAVLGVQRSDAGGVAIVGNITVFGADLPHPLTGRPLGNAFAQQATPTAVRPQSALAIGDGTTVAFTTDIDLAAADLAAAIAAGSIMVEQPAFKLTGTFAADSAGAITGTGSNLDPEVKVGDTVIIGGVAGTITARSSDTAATWDSRVVVAAGATGVNTSRDRRFKRVFAAAGATVGNPEQVEATVVNSKLVLTFMVAPPNVGPNASAAPAPGTARGSMPIDPGAAYLVTPVEVLSAGAHITERIGVRSRSVMFVQFSDIQTAANRTLVTLEHAAE